MNNSRSRNNRNRRVVGRNQQYGQLQRPNTISRNLVQPRAQRTLGVVVTQEAARMQLDPIRNGIRVRNREIVRTIARTATAGAIPFGADIIYWAFNNAQTTVPGSPSASTLGPYLWVGQLATLYDKYIIKKLHFEYIPSLPFTSTGQVGMWWDSDPDPVAPTSFQQLSGNVYAKAVHQSQPCNLAIRPNQVDRLPQYQTSLSVTSSSDTATAGVFNFVNQAGTTGGSSTGALTLGTVWIDYEIEFLNPGNPTLGQTFLRQDTTTDALSRKIDSINRRINALKVAQPVAQPEQVELKIPMVPSHTQFVLPDSEALGPAYKVAAEMFKGNHSGEL